MSSTSTNSSKGFSIIIVGGGIAGLAAATTLAQQGHDVTVLESKPALNEFGASIGILPQGVRLLKAWGLEQAFDKVVTKNGGIDVRDGPTNTRLAYFVQNIKNTSRIRYGDDVWNINRKDYQQTLADAAGTNGAKILFNADTVRVDVEKCIVFLQDGRELTADVILGADGMRSPVRHSIPALAHVEPIDLKQRVYRCTVPKEKMRGNPKIEWLLDVGNAFVFLDLGRYILSWPLPLNRAYDVVLGSNKPSGVPPGRWGVKGDPEVARQDFDDWCPEVVELLKHIEGCVEWTLAELPPLSTCRSENGRVALLGDAYHAMLPHSASGGNSAIEDAACISECLTWAYHNNRPVTEATQAYETLRQPRVQRYQRASQEGDTALLNAPQEFIPIRNAAMAAQTKANEEDLALPEEVRRARPKEQPDMHARFPLEPYIQWLYGYDAIADTREYLATL